MNQTGDEMTETGRMEEVMEEDNVESHQNDGVNEMRLNFDIKKDESHLVQIKASNAEILRRISAFIEQKQIEVDKNNRQEFCNVHPSIEDEEETCARCRAVFIPRGDGKSHIKVSRVVNMYGPQTQASSSNRHFSPQKSHIKQEPLSTDGMEERLANMEAHLNLRALSKVDIYKRLKNLEERILFLESLSPEYFSSGGKLDNQKSVSGPHGPLFSSPVKPPTPKKKRQSSRSLMEEQEDIKDMSLSEIDSRIASLREALLKKSVPSTF